MKGKSILFIVIVCLFQFLFVSQLYGQNSDGSMFKYNFQRTGVFETKGVVQLHGEKWAFNTGGQIYSDPIVSNGVVLFTQEAARYNYALNAETGEVKWNYDRGLVEAVVSANGYVLYTGYSGDMFAVDAETGRERWHTKLPKIHNAPLVKDGIIYVGTDYDDARGIGAFATLELETGKILWHTEIGGIQSSPALYNDTIYTGGEFDLYALDLSGKVKWKFDTGYYVDSTPAVADGTVYFGSLDCYFYAVDAETGKMKWKFETGDFISSSPAAYKNTVYFGSWDRYFYALDSRTGELKWKYETGDRIRSSPAIAEGIVYFGGGDGLVYALDAETGDLVWSYNIGGRISSSPFIWEGKLYIGSSNGYLVALY